MDHLPTEVLQIICGYLSSLDVLSFRLSSRIHAAVGAQHMLPAVVIALMPESLARLKDISEHQVISQHVNTLVYQLGRLPEILDYKDYKRKARISNDERIDTPWPPPPAESDKRARKAYDRELAKAATFLDLAPSKTLQKGWDDYLQLHNEVAELENTDIEFAILESAIAKFPRLAAIRVQCRFKYDETGLPSIHGRYYDCFVLPVDPTMGDELCGVRPLHNLLLCASAAGIRLQYLWAGPISWKFFAHDRNGLAQTVGSRGDLRELRMEVGIFDYDDPLHELRETFRDCVRSFSDGCVRDFLAASKQLEFMEILFEKLDLAENPLYPINTDNVFGYHTWDRLRRLSLRGIATEEQYLLDFFKRHAKTLKHLALEDFCLRGPRCSWISVFERTPTILHLDSASIRGSFCCDVHGKDIYMDEPFDGTSLGDLISGFLLLYVPPVLHAERMLRSHRIKTLETLFALKRLIFG